VDVGARKGQTLTLETRTPHEAFTLKVKRIQRPREHAVRCVRDPQARDILTTLTTSSRRPADDRVYSGAMFIII